MLHHNNIPVDILEKFLETYNNLGYDKTSHFLNNLVPINYYDLMRRFIMTIVCREFHITKEEIISGTSKGLRFDALSAYVFFTKKILKTSHTKLIVQLNKKSRTSIRNCILRIESLDPKINNDKELIDKIKNIDNKINEQLKIFNQSQNLDKNGQSDKTNE